MNNFSLGHLMGCVETGLAPEQLPGATGFATKLASAGAPVGRTICRAAWEVMKKAGYGQTAPALHLRQVAHATEWTLHHEEVANDVTRAALATGHIKKAFSDALGALGLGARGLAYGSLGLGAGAGGLYWLLSRHANQDEADTEATEHQADYYDSLAQELNNSMRRKYRYAGQQQH